VAGITAVAGRWSRHLEPQMTGPDSRRESGPVVPPHSPFPRFPIPDCRFPRVGLRWAVDSPFPIADSPTPNPDSRFPIPYFPSCFAMKYVRYIAVANASTPMIVTTVSRNAPGSQCAAPVIGPSSSEATASSTSRSARCISPPLHSTPTSPPFALITHHHRGTRCQQHGEHGPAVRLEVHRQSHEREHLGEPVEHGVEKLAIVRADPTGPCNASI